MCAGVKVLLFAALGAASGAALTACASGPRNQRPEVSVPVAWRELAVDWRPAAPAAVTAAPWWKGFADPVLDGLETRIDVSNQTLKAAAASYAMATAAVKEDRAGYWPTVAVAADESRAAKGASPATNIKSAGATASWEPDVWGRVRRTVEASRAAAAASADDLAATRLALQAALATDYFELRIQDRVQTLLDSTVRGYQQALQITQNRYQAGVAARADVVTAQTQLLGVQAQQLNAGIQRAQLEHAIAILVGQPPASFELPATTLPATVPAVPVDVPSALLQRRPDVAAAERLVAAANAGIGVARSAYFPALTIGASDSYANTVVGALFSLPNRVWSFGPGLVATLFDGGARHARVAQTRAAYDQSVANYRQSVLVAIQEVEDALVNLRLLQRQAGVEGTLVASAHEAENLTLNQYKAGTVPYSSVISAQATALSAEQTALGVLRSRLTGTVSLIAALGGGM